MIKKSILILCLHLCVISFSYANNNQPSGTQRKVPIVVYTPFDLYTEIMDAFKASDTQDYYLVSDDEIFVHDARYGRDYYRGKYQERKLRAVKQALNISRFKEIILQNDSCFFFSPTYYNKYDNQYLGLLHNNTLRFVDVNGKAYESLESLLLNFSNANFLDTYYDDYIEEVRSGLYSTNTRNYIYHIQNQEDAKSILKNNYNFIFFYDNNVDGAISNFSKYIHSIIDVDNAVLEEVEKDLHEFYANHSGSNNFNTDFGSYISNNYIDYIPLMFLNTNEILAKHLSVDDYSTFINRHRIDHTKAIAAYRFLATKYNSEINKDGVPTSIRYDKIIHYLNENLIFT